MSKKKLKITLKCLPGEKAKFPSSKCVLPISVGQKYHEDDYLRATIAAIEKNFKECVIVVCDSLQRHTLQLINELTPEAAYLQSLELGAGWVSRNKEILKRLSIPYSVRRWDEWMNSSAFTKQRDVTEQYYLNDHVFKNSVDTSVALFVERKKSKLDNFKTNSDFLVERCKEYVLEECSVMPLWVDENINYELYPGQRMPGMEFVHKHFVLLKSEDLLKRVILIFRY